MNKSKVIKCLAFSLSIFLGSPMGNAGSQHFFDRNRSYEDVKAFLKVLSVQHPDTVKLLSIGRSDAGQEIMALKIGEGTVSHLLVAAHHGNEFASTELALAFAEATAVEPLEDTSLFIVPVLNTSGYDRRSRRERSRTGRSFDPNRDYPGPCGSGGPWGLQSTTNLANFIETQKIVAAATIHSYWPAVVYPWGNSAEEYQTINDETFIKLAEDATIHSRYEIGYSSEVIYPADGTFEDYVYWKHGIWGMLFEVGHSHIPNERSVEEMIQANLPGLRLMFQNAPNTRASSHNFDTECVAKALRLPDLHIE